MTRVVLAAAHLDSDPTNNRLKNLRALCQRCHMLHDRPHHLAQRWITYRRRLAVGDLFLGPYLALIAALTSKRPAAHLRNAYSLTTPPSRLSTIGAAVGPAYNGYHDGTLAVGGTAGGCLTRPQRRRTRDEEGRRIGIIRPAQSIIARSGTFARAGPHGPTELASFGSDLAESPRKSITSREAAQARPALPSSPPGGSACEAP